MCGFPADTWSTGPWQRTWRNQRLCFLSLVWEKDTVLAYFLPSIKIEWGGERRWETRVTPFQGSTLACSLIFPNTVSKFSPVMQTPMVSWLVLSGRNEVWFLPSLHEMLSFLNKLVLILCEIENTAFSRWPDGPANLMASGTHISSPLPPRWQLLIPPDANLSGVLPPIVIF